MYLKDQCLIHTFRIVNNAQIIFKTFMLYIFSFFEFHGGSKIIFFNKDMDYFGQLKNFEFFLK